MKLPVYREIEVIENEWKWIHLYSFSFFLLPSVLHSLSLYTSSACTSSALEPTPASEHERNTLTRGHFLIYHFLNFNCNYFYSKSNINDKNKVENEMKTAIGPSLTYKTPDAVTTAGFWLCDDIHPYSFLKYACSYRQTIDPCKCCHTHREVKHLRIKFIDFLPIDCSCNSIVDISSAVDV